MFQYFLKCIQTLNQQEIDSLLSHFKFLMSFIKYFKLNLTFFVLVCDIYALMETHQVPLLVPHGIIKQLIYWAVPALPEGRSLAATFLVLLLCPQHLHTHEERTRLVSLLFLK